MVMRLSEYEEIEHKFVTKIFYEHMFVTKIFYINYYNNVLRLQQILQMSYKTYTCVDKTPKEQMFVIFVIIASNRSSHWYHCVSGICYLLSRK